MAMHNSEAKSVIQLESFQNIQLLSGHGGSHPIFTADKDNQTWYLKESRRYLAEREVVAQKIFQLFIPGQPDCSLAISGEKAYVAIQKIQNYKSLESINFKHPERTKKKLDSGDYYGLGIITVLCLALNEIDLKPAHIGIGKQDTQGKYPLFKIDSDWCLGILRMIEQNLGKKKKLSPPSLSEKNIDALPFPAQGYFVANWLDIVVNYQASPDSAIVSQSLGVSNSFRSEVNETLLKYLLLPNKVLELIVYDTVTDTDSARQILDQIYYVREQLKSAVKEDESFQAFLGSKYAVNVIKQFDQELNQIELLKGFNLKINDDFSTLMNIRTQPSPTPPLEIADKKPQWMQLFQPVKPDKKETPELEPTTNSEKKNPSQKFGGSSELT